MSVRRFLIAYLGIIVLFGVTAGASIRALKQRHAATIAAVAPESAMAPAMPEPAVTQPQQMAAVVAPRMPPPPPKTRVVLPIPPLAPHVAAPQPVRTHASKPRQPAPTVVAARPAPRRYPPPGPDSGPPNYGPGPYVAGWSSPGPAMPRPVQSYPYYPYAPGYYGYYPQPPYYRSF